MLKTRCTTRSLSASRPGLVRRPGLRQKISSPSPVSSDFNTTQSPGNEMNARSHTPELEKNDSRNSAGKKDNGQTQLKTKKRALLRSRKSRERTHNNSIIVLGAGVSGLACAKELQARGYDVIVLEARNRPGGRLKTEYLRLTNKNKSTSYSSSSNICELYPIDKQKGEQIKKRSKRQATHPMNKQYNILSTPPPSDDTSAKPTFCPVDMGGAFIHGIDNNPVYKLCNRMCISTSHAMKECLLLEYHNTGWPVSVEMDLKVQKRFNDVLDKALKMSEMILSMEANAVQKFVEVNSLNNADTLSNDSLSAGQDLTMTPEPLPAPHCELDIPLPKGVNSSTSFGVIFHHIASDGKAEGRVIDGEKINNRAVGSDKLDSNGGYQSSSTEASLFRWHVLNLEMSCGTNLGNLGLTWNDDEQYGFGGAHVLLREGFSCMINGLAEGLDVKYENEVSGVRIIGAGEGQCILQKEYVSLEDSNNKESERNYASTCVTEGINIIRRSSRSNKGKFKHGRMNIGVLNKNQKELGTYDVNNSLLSAWSKDRSKNDEKWSSFPRVEVRTKSGLTFDADAVVCTLPLGVLAISDGETGHIQFSPPLPKRKKEAINRIGFGRYNKCALSFPYIFWNSADDFIGVIGCPVAGTNILFCNVSVMHDLPCIVMIYGGSYAQEMENLTDQVVVGECMEVLRRVYGGKRRKKGGQVTESMENKNVPNPIDSFVSRWGTDPFARGSFSYIPPGVDGFKELQIMSEPVFFEEINLTNSKQSRQRRGTSPPNLKISGRSQEISSAIIGRPRILFAGEATTPFHPSTIHGAYISGIREAYRLDLSFEPEGNKSMTFCDETLYTRTFDVRKRLASQKSPATSNVKVKRRKQSIQNVSGSRKSRRQLELLASNSTRTSR